MRWVFCFGRDVASGSCAGRSPLRSQSFATAKQGTSSKLEERRAKTGSRDRGHARGAPFCSTQQKKKDTQRIIECPLLSLPDTVWTYLGGVRKFECGKNLCMDLFCKRSAVKPFFRRTFWRFSSVTLMDAATMRVPSDSCRMSPKVSNGQPEF